jgi:hypothetical protein
MVENTAMQTFSRILPIQLLILIGMAWLAPTSHSQAASQILPEDLNKMVKTQIWWDTAPPSANNPKGLQLRFAKIEEPDSDGQQRVRYRVYLPGPVESEKYTLQSWVIGTRVRDMDTVFNKVYVNRKGLLMTDKPRSNQKNKETALNDGEVVIVAKAAHGEPQRYVLSNSKKNILVTGTVVPYPIESKNGDCQLEARLASKEGDAILLYADGLPPSTDVQYQLASADESHDATFHVDAHGHASDFVLPVVAGKDFGVLKVSINTQACTVSVGISWGKGSYHPLLN